MDNTDFYAWLRNRGSPRKFPAWHVLILISFWCLISKALCWRVRRVFGKHVVWFQAVFDWGFVHEILLQQTESLKLLVCCSSIAEARFLDDWVLVWRECIVWVCLHVGWWAIVHIYCNFKTEMSGISASRNNDFACSFSYSWPVWNFVWPKDGFA